MPIYINYLFLIVLIGFSSISCKTTENYSSPKSNNWQDFFRGQDINDVLFGNTGRKNTAISAKENSYIIQDEVELRLKLELPLNLSKTAAKGVANRIGKNLDPKVIKKMAGVELTAEVEVEYKKSAHIVIKTSNPNLGPSFIEKNGFKYFNVMPSREQYLYCLQKVKII